MAEVQRFIRSFGGSPVLLADTIADETEDFEWPEDWIGRANSYECPTGMEAGHGWVLMRELHADFLNMNATTTLTWVEKFDSATAGLKFRAAGGGNKTTNFQGLIPIRVTKMSAGTGGQGQNRVCLVEFADKRIAIRGTVNRQYNVRMPAPKTLPSPDNFYTESLNGGAVWTWEQIFDDLWGNLNAEAGAAINLPYVPDGTPDGLRFIGVPAWQAIGVFLDKIGCTIAFDPTTNTLSAIRLGTTQAGLAAAKVAVADKLLFDYDPSEGNLWKAPATFRVFFHRKEEYHGIEKDTPQNDNWEMQPAHSVDVASGVAGGSGILPIWDDLPAMHSDTEAIVNAAAIATRATEVATNMGNRIADARARLHYSGILTTMLPGAEVASVVWRDYGDEQGTVTEIRNFPPGETQVGGHGVSSPHMMRQTLPSGVAEVLEASGLGRAKAPTYPRLPQFVKITGAEDATGGIWPGTVERYVRGAWTSLDTCWVAPIHGATDQGFETGSRQIGRLAGLQVGTSSPTTRPVYVADPVCRAVIVRFTLTGTLSLGGSAGATVLACVSDTRCHGADLVGTSITVEDFSGSPGTWKSNIGKEGVAYWNGDVACNYTILWVEEQAVFIEVTTTAVFSGGVSASPTLVDSWQGYPPASITLEDKCGAYANKAIGSCIVACYHDEDDRYIPIDPTLPDVSQLCFSYGSESATVSNVSLLSVSKNWAHLENRGAGHGHVQFRRGSRDSMFWNVGSNSTISPFWTTCAKLGSDLELLGEIGGGFSERGGTLTLSHATLAVSGSHILQSTAGPGSVHFWKLPFEPTDAGVQFEGRHLFVTKHSGSDDSPCLQWEYSLPGWSSNPTGLLLVDKNDWTYEFTCGILTYSTNPDFFICPIDSDVTCTSPACTNDNPCA